MVLPRLKTSLLDISMAVINGSLSDVNIEWNDKSCVCVVVASGGYPVKYEKNKKISGLNSNGQLNNAVIYHAGTKYENNDFLTSGGRVLGVTCLGDTLSEAIKNAYEAVSNISFENMHYRHDIGSKR